MESENKMLGNEIIDNALRRAYNLPSVPESYFASSGMHPEELYRLHDLVQSISAQNVLEIGMARGTSTVALLAALDQVGGGKLTSLDPFQRKTYDGEGLKAVERSGLSGRHIFMEELDYIALPQLVADGRTFDLIFIDGDHSFDYTMVDFFYADILLRDGGVVAFHDSDWAGVVKVLEYIAKNKPYERLSPMIWNGYPTRLERIWRGGVKLMKSSISARFRGEVSARAEKWIGLSAYRKVSAERSGGSAQSARPF